MAEKTIVWDGEEMNLVCENHAITGFRIHNQSGDVICHCNPCEFSDSYKYILYENSAESTLVLFCNTKNGELKIDRVFSKNDIAFVSFWNTSGNFTEFCDTEAIY